MTDISVEVWEIHFTVILNQTGGGHDYPTTVYTTHTSKSIANLQQ